MNHAIQLPHFENHERVLKMTTIISLFAHIFLLGALSWAFPYASPKAKETGIDVDLTVLDEPAPQKMQMEQVADNSPPPPQAEPESAPKSDPQPVKAEKPAEPKPAPDEIPVPTPKKVEKPKPVQKKTTAARPTATQTVASNNPSATQSSSLLASKSTNATGQARVSAPAPKSGTNPKPEYPELARKRNQEGTTRIRCQVDNNGNVVSVEVAQSSGYKLLDDAALKTVRRWSFTPAMSASGPVSGTVIVPVSFKLR